MSISPFTPIITSLKTPLFIVNSHTLSYWFLGCLLFLLSCYPAEAFIEGIYCGTENYYDVLDVNRDSGRDEIVRAYRRMAKKFHPDMHRSKDAKEEASKKFLVIASAYEVLRDEESRRDYDYMLDNPELVYSHYYAYYRRKYAPKVDVRIVVVFTITVISAFQYYAAFSRHKEAIDFFLSVPKYRIKAQEIAKEDGLLNSTKKRRNKSKEEIKEEEEMILRKIIEEKMDIKGGYSKPSAHDVLWVQLILLPYHLVLYVIWGIRWIWKFFILKEEYGDEEIEYLIRRNMGLSQVQWDALEEDERESYIADELWIKSNYKDWKQKKDEDMKAKLAESSSYKRYRRWMKKGGAGQITLIDD